MDGLVSVIIPCFRQATYLPDAVRTALDQTYADIEVIVVDDGSPDDVAGALVPFAGDPRLRIERQDNAGVSAARNRGLALARGEFIQFLDADDYIAAEKIERQVAALRAAPEAAIAYSDFWEIDWASGKHILNDADDMASLETDAVTALWAYCPYPPAVPLVRRSWIDRAGRFRTDLAYGEDFEYWARLALLGAPMVRVEGQLAYYRHHPASATATYGQENEAQALIRVRRDLAEAFPAAVARAEVDGFVVLARRLAHGRGMPEQLESAKEQIARKESELVIVHEAYADHVQRSAEAYASLRAAYDDVVDQLAAARAAAPQVRLDGIRRRLPFWQPRTID